MITVFNNVPMGSGMTMFNCWLAFKYRKEFGIITTYKQPNFDSMYRIDWDKVMQDNKKRKAV
jgi:hypothetical protein